MLHYSNIVRYEGLSFEDYLKLPGYSHSFLKREYMGMVDEIVITDNIRIGKMVDGILMDPEAVDMNDQLYPIARKIAVDIKNTFGAIIPQFKAQVSFTANIEHAGFSMETKGRLDWELPKHAVIDLKVTKMRDIPALIKFMGYDNQTWHYGHLSEVKDAYLMIHSIPLKRNFFIPSDVSMSTNDFWAEKTMLFGKALA